MYPIANTNLLRHVQITISAEVSEVMKKLGLAVLPVDGIARISMESLDDFFALMNDDEYQSVRIRPLYPPRHGADISYSSLGCLPQRRQVSG
jgi:hypothetical protein